MKILHIDSSILDNGSVTRELSAVVVAAITKKYSESHTRYRDLVKNEIRHLTGPIAAGFRKLELGLSDEATLHEHQISEELVSEFLSSNIIVLGSPMYNFSIASQLKAWLDRIAQVGRTFKYTENGPVGLSGHKTVIVVSARGGFYAEGPAAAMDFQESYLKAFLGFLGVTDVRFVRAEGISKGDATRETGVTRAKQSIAEVVDTLTITV